MYDNKDWKYGFYYLYIDNTGKEFHNILNQEEEVIVNHLGSVVPVFTNVDKETIGQYIGLKDKNGIEIYEGDILYDDFYEKRATVVFVNSAFCLDYGEEFNKYGTNHSRYTYIGEYSPEVLEVLGNICENSELLKESEE